jgi:uncharacterized protein YaiE (UPF0345 family)
MNHKVYFDGRVQSIWFRVSGGNASVGVIAPGSYSFSTDGPEQVIVLTGQLAVKLPREGWRTVQAPGAYVVPANSQFEVRAEGDVSYLCRFEATESST